MSSDTQDGASHENNSFDDPSRREFVKSVGAGLGGVLLGASSLAGCGGSSSNRGSEGDAQADNLIIRENNRSGNTGWEPANVTTTRSIEGYTTRDSVNPGDPLEFCVSSGSSDYAIDLYRLAGGALRYPCEMAEDAARAFVLGAAVVGAMARRQ